MCVYVQSFVEVGEKQSSARYTSIVRARARARAHPESGGIPVRPQVRTLLPFEDLTDLVKDVVALVPGRLVMKLSGRASSLFLSAYYAYELAWQARVKRAHGERARVCARTHARTHARTRARTPPSTHVPRQSTRNVPGQEKYEHPRFWAQFQAVRKEFLFHEPRP